MRLEHDVHGFFHGNIMALRDERVIILLAVAASLVGQELLTHGRNIMETIAVACSSDAERAKILWRISVSCARKVRSNERCSRSRSS